MRHPDIVTREGTVLLVCDVQKGCIKPIFRKEKMINKIKALVSFAGMIGLPIIITELMPQNYGTTIEEIKNLLPRLEPIKRARFSCFGNEDLTLRLEAMNINTIIIAGMETHISICQTVLDALTRGYKVHVALDATSSRHKVNWRIALEKMRRAGAVITTAEIVIHELIERIDIPQYEKIREILNER